MKAPKVERLSSGIPGLDKLLKGGIPQGAVVLVSGGTGCGKTTFGCQYLWHGLQKGENGLYLTLEESPEEIKNDSLQFGWDFSKFEDKGAFRIVYYDPFELGEIITRMTDLIVVNKVKRLVIDSISLFGLYLKDEYKIRQKMYRLVEALKRTGCTSLILSEILEDSKSLSRYGVEEFVVDGLIVMYYMGIGEGVFRNIEVRKMRRTDHKNGTFPFKITSRGVLVEDESTMMGS